MSISLITTGEDQSLYYILIAKVMHPFLWKKSEKYDDKIRKNMKKSMFDRFDLEIDPKGQIPML